LRSTRNREYLRTHVERNYKLWLMLGIIKQLSM